MYLFASVLFVNALFVNALIVNVIACQGYPSNLLNMVYPSAFLVNLKKPDWLTPNEGNPHLLEL